MKHRDVVANFLFKKVSGEVLVALFRRSTNPNVRTYQGKFAPISGSIEPTDADALAAAAREIQEETQLRAHKDITLGFAGKPFFFADDASQRSWTVHPIGWSLEVEDSRIQIDWEHSSWNWFRPEEVLSGSMRNDCVPQLDKSLMRVYFGPGGIFVDRHSLVSRDNSAGKVFLSTLNKLRNDKDNGARMLASDALKSLQELLTVLKLGNSDRGDREFWWPTLQIAAYHFVYSGRPSMNSAIKSAILQPFKSFDNKTVPDVSLLNNTIATCISDREHSSTRISQALQSYIGELNKAETESHKLNIITLSSSSTIRLSILSLLTALPDLELCLTILESRPKCEGALLAANLLELTKNTPASSRLHIELAPDCHVAFLVQRYQNTNQNTPLIVLLGADRITPSGHVSNKMGSLALAMISKMLIPNSKVVVLSEADKIATPSDLLGYKSGEYDSTKELQEHTPEPNDITEVTKVWGHFMPATNIDHVLASNTDKEQTEIHNYYFEMVPYHWIDTYICEDGPQSREEILMKSIQLGELEEKIFGDLYT